MVDSLIVLAALLAGVAFMLELWLFFQGPSDADRVVAFDTLTVISLTGIVLIAYQIGRASCRERV